MSVSQKQTEDGSYQMDNSFIHVSKIGSKAQFLNTKLKSERFGIPFSLSPR